MKRARAIIIAKGEVQGVGYRGVVFKIARKFEYFEIWRGDMTEELGERSDLARYEMKKFNFTTLREDYGKISENIEKPIPSIDRTSKNTERILDEMKEERKESRMAMDKILNTILKLAEKSS